MVYCGKPSKGCQICRQRKIKCDQSLPGCGQCVKAQKECPGYRDQLDLMFRNESAAVVKKVRDREVMKKQVLAPSHQSIPPSAPLLVEPTSLASSSLQTASRQYEMPRSLDLSAIFALALDDKASDFFYRNFVVNMRNRSGGLQDHTPDIFRSCDANPQLLASMKAVGLAGFANTVEAPVIMREAFKHYQDALHLTNTALQSPKVAKQDSTLLSILVLSLFETVTGQNQRSLRAWCEHITGAATLVKLRGHEQLMTPTGFRMFIQVSSMVLVSCIQRELPFPEQLSELRRDAEQFVTPSDIAWQIQEACIVFSRFRAALANHTITDLEQILTRALEIDGIFITVLEEASSDWKYETIHTKERPDIVCCGYYHVYHDYWQAQIWNASRACRILLNETIRATLLKGFSALPPLFIAAEYAAQFAISTSALYKLQGDILATVPQHLGEITVSGKLRVPSTELGAGFVEPPMPSQRTARGSYNRSCHAKKSCIIPSEQTGVIMKASLKHGVGNDSELPNVRGGGGYFLIWPLFVSGSMDIATDEIRLWVCRVLRSVGRKMGVNQAIALAGFLERKERIYAWHQRQDRPRKGGLPSTWYNEQAQGEGEETLKTVEGFVPRNGGLAAATRVDLPSHSMI